MIGKSAHGNSGKVPYYEHGWAARMQSVTLKKVCDCKPFRLQAKKLEPLVWAEVEKLMATPEMAKSLIDELKAIHLERTQSSESKDAERIRQLGMQMDVLAERLSELPKSVSPVAIFKQMEKLEEVRNLEEEKLCGLRPKKSLLIHLQLSERAHRSYLRGLKQHAESEAGHITRDRIVRSLIHKVEVTPDGFRLHFHLGRGYIEGELARYGRSALHRGGVLGI